MQRDHARRQVASGLARCAGDTATAADVSNSVNSEAHANAAVMQARLGWGAKITAQPPNAAAQTA